MVVRQFSSNDVPVPRSSRRPGRRHSRSLHRSDTVVAGRQVGRWPQRQQQHGFTATPAFHRQQEPAEPSVQRLPAQCDGADCQDAFPARVFDFAPATVYYLKLAHPCSTNLLPWWNRQGFPRFKVNHGGTEMKFQVWLHPWVSLNFWWIPCNGVNLHRPG